MPKLGLSQLALLVLPLNRIWVEFHLFPRPVPMEAGPLLACLAFLLLSGIGALPQVPGRVCTI